MGRAAIDRETGIVRFSDNEELYDQFLFEFLADSSFDRLVDALGQDDVVEAFEAAHMLKGVSGNLSLIGLYRESIPLVESLRAGKLDEAKVYHQGLAVVYQETINKIKEMERSDRDEKSVRE